MKNIIFGIMLFGMSFLNAQNHNIGIVGNENWMQNWTNFKPKTTIYRESDIILSGKIVSNMLLEKKHTYTIIGSVYLIDNAILTIEPGTVIRGDYATDGTLIVTKGARIIAEGTEVDPIIFTSSKGVLDRNSGDWGGIIILGDAPINKFGGRSTLDFNLDSRYAVYGGNNIDSDSGILKFVRIEFSGRKINSTKELNGLSLAGVGLKTKLENIQISFSNDDSFECYGGNVEMSRLISFKATDDDFDFTQGVQANISNSVAIRYPFYSDISKSRCFEIDSFDKVENTDFTKKMTVVNATNMTFLNIEDNNQGLIKEAIYLKEQSFLNFSNSLISGFASAVWFDLNSENKLDYLHKLHFKNLIFNNCKNNFNAENMDDSFEAQNFLDVQNAGISISTKALNDLIIGIDFKKNVDLRKINIEVITTR